MSRITSPEQLTPEQQARIHERTALLQMKYTKAQACIGEAATRIQRAVALNDYNGMHDDATCIANQSIRAHKLLQEWRAWQKDPVKMILRGY